MTSHRSPSEAERDTLRLLEVYGASRAAWPAAAAPLYDAARSDPEFAAPFADAERLDAALAGADLRASGTLKARILADFAATSAGAARFLRFAWRRLLPVGALAGFAGFGFALGAASAREQPLDYAEIALAQSAGEDADLWSEYGR